MGKTGRIGAQSAALVIALSALPHASFGQPASAQEARPLDVITTLPPGPGPFPAVIMAPGGNYDMRQPLMEKLTKALAARNIATVRFDWTYFTRDGQQGHASPDLSDEVADMKAALAAARGNTHIDPQRIILAGKSQGSVVAFSVFRSEPSVRAAVLFTPVCTVSASGRAPPWTAEPYRGLAAETRPVAFIQGDSDPICRTRDLYALVTANPGSVRVATLGGDHVFASKGDAGAQQRNLDVAVANALNAAEQWLAPGAAAPKP